jgi:hypothetical protein
MTARGALQAPQVTSDRYQVTRGSAAEAVEDDTAAAVKVEPFRQAQGPEHVEGRGVPDALGSEPDAPWPGMADEASFLADQRGQGIVPPAGPTNEPTDLSPLPSLEELVQRIPAEARAALDDLFRAKFTGVRRVSKKSLKA